MSQATICASDLTRARPQASAGSSFGPGCVSSSHSTIASDCVSTPWPATVSAGTRAELDLPAIEAAHAKVLAEDGKKQVTWRILPVVVK
jgi:hypothetical protein